MNNGRRVQPGEGGMEGGPEGFPTTTDRGNTSGTPEGYGGARQNSVSFNRQLKTEGGVVICACDGTARSIANCFTTIKTGHLNRTELSRMMGTCAGQGLHVLSKEIEKKFITDGDRDPEDKS